MLNGCGYENGHGTIFGNGRGTGYYWNFGGIDRFPHLRGFGNAAFDKGCGAVMTDKLTLSIGYYCDL